MYFDTKFYKKRSRHQLRTGNCLAVIVVVVSSRILFQNIFAGLVVASNNSMKVDDDFLQWSAVVVGRSTVRNSSSVV